MSKTFPLKTLFFLAAILLIVAQGCTGASFAPSLTAGNSTIPDPSTLEPFTTAQVEASVSPAEIHNFVVSPSLVQIDMFDELNGWALTGQGVLRTTDGGIGWIDAGPDAIFPADAVLHNFFLDADTGWVLPVDPQSSAETGTLYRTSDAGQTWELVTLPFSAGQLYFIDPQNGWALVDRGVAAGSHAVDIYQTTDGGSLWDRVHSIDPSQPEQPGSLRFGGVKNGLAFRDQTHGWIGGTVPCEACVWLYLTQDGGRTWQSQDLEIPADFTSHFLSIDPPRFFNSQDGVLPVAFFAETSARDFYVTHDGGGTWNATTPVPLAGLYSLPTPQDFFTWQETSLAASHDGGQTWTQIAPNIDLGPSLLQLEFVNASTGWAISAAEDGQRHLYKSTDGGATWTRLF